MQNYGKLPRTCEDFRPAVRVFGSLVIIRDDVTTSITQMRVKKRIAKNKWVQSRNTQVSFIHAPYARKMFAPKRLLPTGTKSSYGILRATRTSRFVSSELRPLRHRRTDAASSLPFAFPREADGPYCARAHPFPALLPPRTSKSTTTSEEPCNKRQRQNAKKKTAPKKGSSDARKGSRSGGVLGAHRRARPKPKPLLPRPARARAHPRSGCVSELLGTSGPAPYSPRPPCAARGASAHWRTEGQ